jgi:Asp/Glu/hydantoin racemase
MLKGFLDIPVIAVDRPMLERAVYEGTKIGVIATNPAGGPAAREQMEKIAAESGKTSEFIVEIVEEALESLKAGDTGRHDMLIAAAGQRLVDKGCDVIVLAQITMARAAAIMQGLEVPVLTSPDEGVLALCNAIRNQTKVRKGGLSLHLTDQRP